MPWDIDQYNAGYDYDDEGERQQWGVRELVNDAHNWEGIIVTIDGQRHDIPIGGGIVRTSSALNFGPWIDSCDPPEGWLSYVTRTYLWPEIVDNIYQGNMILNRLMKQNRKASEPTPKMPDGLLYSRHVPLAGFLKPSGIWDE